MLLEGSIAFLKEQINRKDRVNNSLLNQSSKEKIFNTLCKVRLPISKQNSVFDLSKVKK